MMVVAVAPLEPNERRPLREVVIVDRNRLAAMALAKLIGLAIPEAVVAIGDAIPSGPLRAGLLLLKVDPQQSWQDLLAGGRVIDHSVPVVLLVEELDPGMLLEALAIGVSGILTPKDSPIEFIEALESANRGHTALSTAAFQCVLDRAAGAPSGPAVASTKSLSPAEMAVLLLLAEAKSVRTIATTRGVTPKTVRNHLANVYRKLEVSGRTEAIISAARLGLVSLERADRLGQPPGRIRDDPKSRPSGAH